MIAGRDAGGDEEPRRAYDPRRIVRNFQAAVAGEAVVRGTSFLATILVARALSTADFGRFSFVVALVSVGILVSDVGLQVAATRAIAGDRPRASAYVTSALILGGAFALASYAVIVSLGRLGLLPFGVANAAAIFGFVLFLTVGTNAWGAHLRGFERQDLIYLAHGLSALALLAGVVVLTRREPSVEAVLVIWVVSFALRLALTLAFLTSKVERPRWELDRPIVKSVAVAAPAVALAYVLQGAYSHLDIVLLGFLVASASVGEYGAAYRLIDGVTFLTAGAATAAVFPVFSRLAQEQPADVPRLYGIVTRFTAAALAPLMFLLVALAGPLVEIVYGAGNPGTVRLFALLAPSTILIAMNFVAAFVALAIGCTREAIVCTGSAAAVNVAANLIGVPLFGVEAAAVATFGAELVMLLLFQYALSRHLEGAWVLRAGAGAASVATGALAIVLLLPDAQTVAGIAGAAIALPLFRLTRAFHAADVRRLRAALVSRR